MRRTAAILVLVGLCLPANAADLVKTYEYFPVRGADMEAIAADMEKLGPHVNTTGSRHPGATRMSFTTRLTYGSTGSSCRIVKASVTLNARVILPRWSGNRKADEATSLVWYTLAGDIKRHEESHVVIARNHARQIEKAMLAIWPKQTCADVSVKAKEVSGRILAQHDRAQAYFDTVETANFENRIERLLRYRIQQINAAKTPES